MGQVVLTMASASIPDAAASITFDRTEFSMNLMYVCVRIIYIFIFNSENVKNSNIIVRISVNFQ